jgi:purine-binding chemotaxis protein CheW
MTFKLDAEAYGIEILNVRELIGVMEITRVPRSHAFVRGVINLRGKVIPVIDLRLEFGMAGTEPTDQTVIIVVQIERGGHPLTMGLLVDEVQEVLSVESSSIEPPSTLAGASSDTSFILGIAKMDKRVIFLLDIARVLTGDELDAIARAAA